MTHQNPSQNDIRELLTEAQTVAMIGASSRDNRPSYGIFRKLQSVGYRVIPVNPHEKEVLGEKSYATLHEVPVPIDIVDVFRRSPETPEIADDAVRVGAKTLWLQLGITNEDAAERAKAGGLSVVMDLCIGAAHSVLEVPKKKKSARGSGGSAPLAPDPED